MILPDKRKDLNDPPFEMIKCMKVKVSEELKHSHSMKPVSLEATDVILIAHRIYRISDQRTIRRVCAKAQTRQNLRCSHTQSTNTDEDSCQN